MEFESRFGVTDVHTSEDSTGVNHAESCKARLEQREQGHGKGGDLEGGRPGSKARLPAKVSGPKLLCAFR